MIPLHGKNLCERNEPYPVEIMMLLDSNIIIYAAQPQHRALRRFIATNTPAVSAVSQVEVMGYYKITERELRYFGLFFAAAPVLNVSEAVIHKATELRQQKKMTLGDALIAATALVHQVTLVTHNTKDFVWISASTVRDPIATL